MMKLTKKILILMLLFSCAILTGCNNSEQNTQKKVDDAFLKDLVKGLTTRWDLNEKGINDNEPEDKYFGRLVQAELDVLSPYTSKSFEDTQLQEKAISYINLLKNQQDALTYYNADYVKYDKLWSEAYQDRTQMVKEFIEVYKLEFPKKYDDTVNDFMNTAKVATDNDTLKATVDEMLHTLSFNKVETIGDYSTYEAIIENTTDKTFTYFNVNVNLLDADGVILDSPMAFVNNFAPGKKAKLEFMTDKQFASYELSADYYTE